MVSDKSKGAGEGKAHANVRLIIPFCVSVTICKMGQRKVRSPSVGLEDAFKLDKMSQYCKSKNLGHPLKGSVSILRKKKGGCRKGRREFRKHKEGRGNIGNMHVSKYEKEKVIME